MRSDQLIRCDVYNVHGTLLHTARFVSPPRTGELIVFVNDPQRVLYVVLRVTHLAWSETCNPPITPRDPFINLTVCPEAARSDGRPHVPAYAFKSFTEEPERA